MCQGMWFTTSLFPFSNGPGNSTSRNMQHCHAKAMLCFKSGGSTSAQRKRTSAARLHGGVVGVVVGAKADLGWMSVLCAQTVCFCYYVQTLIANVFFAFAAKLHFTCILALALESSCWLQGLLLSTDRVRMRIRCVQIAYIC